MLIAKTLPAAAVGTTNTSPANNVLTASSTVDRYVRQILVSNPTGGAINLSVGIGAGAALSATNADVCSVLSIPAGAASQQLAAYAGDGRRALGSGSVNAVMAFASATGLLLTVIYREDTLAA